jgi:Transglutaminase-like superfamily
MKMIRILRRALNLPAREQGQALQAAALLAYANVALKLYPFSKAIALGSLPTTPGNSADRHISSIVLAVRRSSYAAPWRTVCIHEGIAAQWMLRREGVPAVLCYGTRQDDGKLQSHVWVKVGDQIVIGGEEAPHFRLVATYPRAEESSTSRPFSSLST